MNTQETRNKIKAYMEIGFTMKEAFFNIKDSARIRTKRSGHRLAEICGNGIKASGREVNYSLTKYL